jgi:methionyl-tRNA formyltransferase
MTQKGFDVLQGLVNEGLHKQIDHICIGKDRDVQNDYSTELEELCRNQGIPFGFRTDKGAIEALKGSRYVIAVSWRWLLELGAAKLIVLHDSLLPRYRGFAPLVNSLKNGEEWLGVTAIEAAAEYDRGAILLQKKIRANYPLKIADAISQVGQLYAELVSELLQALQEGKLAGTPQDEASASYSLWLDGEDYFVDWTWPASRIRRFVDATGYPYDGAKTRMNGETVVLQHVEELPDVEVENRTCGKVIFLQEGRPVVVCGEGLLRIESAVNEGNQSIIPLKKFRTRFT